MRRADGGQLPLLAVAAVGCEAALVHERSVDEREEPALVDLRLAERRAEGALDDLERLARRREERLVAAAGEPQRPADATREMEHGGVALVDPGGGHRADELLEHGWGRPVCVDEREDRLGVDRHLGRVPLEPVALERAPRR